MKKATVYVFQNGVWQEFKAFQTAMIGWNNDNGIISLNDGVNDLFVGHSSMFCFVIEDSK